MKCGTPSFALRSLPPMPASRSSRTRSPSTQSFGIDRELSAIVAETVVEGCIGETLAALQAQAQLNVTTNPAVRAALAATVEDETRHAELAWRVVAWAVREGGPSVRAVAERAFSEFRAPPPPELELGAVNLQHFAEHGRLTPKQARAVALEALEMVVRPFTAGLLSNVFERIACTAWRLPRLGCAYAPTTSAAARRWACALKSTSIVGLSPVWAVAHASGQSAICWFAASMSGTVGHAVGRGTWPGRRSWRRCRLPGRTTLRPWINPARGQRARAEWRTDRRCPRG